ncbi:MAG: type II toxin-antitoxin system Phd/YefM family antitoxin [Alphaproteobacteria bacterium]|nr:type II toxin-antitoxin system Phd/YefM family antitoxin [Alphaproteobacteria bacterium]
MWSHQDARNRFSAVVAAALEGTPQEVTRRGKPAVVVLSTVEYRRLLAFPGTVERAQVTARPVTF